MIMTTCFSSILLTGIVSGTSNHEKLPGKPQKKDEDPAANARMTRWRLTQSLGSTIGSWVSKKSHTPLIGLPGLTEAPSAYKDVDMVVETVSDAGIAKKVAR
jgi:RNA-splicing ligase RtcB